MTDEKSTPSPFSLSFWMDGAENTKLGNAAYRWFSLLGKAASWGVVSRDPMTCGPVALDMLAWERGIKRYEGESERLYRLRVNYAYENGRDAGGVNGWKRILKRLELLGNESDLVLRERMAGQDWDIVGIAFDDSRFAELQTVLEIIIEEYGRTCRRYRFISSIPQTVHVRTGVFDNDHYTIYAAQGDRVAASVPFGGGIFDSDHSTVEASLWAQH